MEGEGRGDTVTQLPGRLPGGDERLYLLVLEEESSAIFHLPRDGRVVIGREPGVELHLRDRAASRRHAELIVRQGEVEVCDLGSHNGTQLNGQRLGAPRLLGSGDVITIGEAGLVFHSARAGGRAPRVVELAQLRRRLVEEVERAAHFHRSLSVAALHFRESPADPRGLALELARGLRAVDFMAWADARELLLVFPELPLERVPSFVAAPPHLAKVVTFPDGGLDADDLIIAARAAPGGTGAALADRVTTIDLGGRTILIADPAMVRLFALVRRLARSDLPVLITGETGVGKESAAFAVHHGSPRAAWRFLPVNCAALPENLVESELFGYEKGAFSGATQAKPGLFELAHGGTLFFDEVGELPLAAQAKLLRVLETRAAMRLGGTREVEVDVRVVAATNRELEVEIEAGRFRRDLFFRLSGATVVLPPLRDRPRELHLLLRAFLRDACARLGRPVPPLSRSVLALLSEYPWPGNVRELKNAIEYAAAAAEESIELEHLPERIAGPSRRAPEPANDRPAPVAAAAGGRKFRALSDEIEELERQRMSDALAAASGVKAQAARLIEMPLRTFVAKLKQYGLA